MMLKLVATTAAFAGYAFGQSLSIPACATPCVSSAQSAFTCDLTQLDCLCPNFGTIDANATIQACFSADCQPTELAPLASVILTECPNLATPTTTSSANTSSTLHLTTTSTPTSSVGSGSTATSNSTSKPTTATAGGCSTRPVELGVGVLVLALAVLFAL